ncbi:MAG: hypothetical protein Q4A06_09225 [Cardiobacteriaceae bacterium]|nr:hypothetical protein [Cardiobacteriaceae bacterium]
MKGEMPELVFSYFTSIKEKISKKYKPHVPPCRICWQHDFAQARRVSSCAKVALFHDFEVP